MPSLKQAVLVSLATACTAVDINKKSYSEWVVADTDAQSCKDVCEALTPKKACNKFRWPTDEASFKTILENIKDVKGDAAVATKCDKFVDMPKDQAFKYHPAIHTGVCWYSKAEEFDCAAKPTAKSKELRICPCTTGDMGVKRVKVPKPLSYPTTYRRAEKVTISFSIKFPWFTYSAFECLAAMTGQKTVAHKEDSKPEAYFKDNKPEAFFKMAYEIKESLGTQAADVTFVAPEVSADPLSANVGIYAAPADMKGAEWFLAETRIRKIGHDVMKKFPELKLCSHATEEDETTYDTDYQNRPVLPAHVVPTGRWSPASKDEVHAGSVQTGSVALSSVDGVIRHGAASVGVLLVVGAMVMWRQRKNLEQAPAGCEELVPAVSE